MQTTTQTFATVYATNACRHAARHHSVIAERPFAGSLATRKVAANPMAHGGVTVTVACRACGATRQENRNGRHVEAGAWHRA